MREIFKNLAEIIRIVINELVGAVVWGWRKLRDNQELVKQLSNFFHIITNFSIQNLGIMLSRFKRFVPQYFTYGFNENNIGKGNRSCKGVSSQMERKIFVYIENSFTAVVINEIVGDIISDINIASVPQVSGFKKILQHNHHYIKVVLGIRL